MLDRGIAFAFAHVRGGDELGWHWYEAGKLADKTNSFTDFIACAEYLIETGYTRAGRIAIHGGSAGGMLMGAVANLRPDLWRCVVADVPFVDVLNTMLDATLPLTPIEWPEWGDPFAGRDGVRRIRSYSPYDNIRAAALSADARDGRYRRSAGDLLGAGEVRGAPARHHDRGRADPAAKSNMGAGHFGKSGRLRRAARAGRAVRLRPRAASASPSATSADAAPQGEAAHDTGEIPAALDDEARRCRERPDRRILILADLEQSQARRDRSRSTSGSSAR